MRQDPSEGLWSLTQSWHHGDLSPQRNSFCMGLAPSLQGLRGRLYRTDSSKTHNGEEKRFRFRGHFTPDDHWWRHSGLKAPQGVSLLVQWQNPRTLQRGGIATCLSPRSRFYNGGHWGLGWLSGFPKLDLQGADWVLGALQPTGLWPEVAGGRSCEIATGKIGDLA